MIRLWVFAAVAFITLAPAAQAHACYSMDEEALVHSALPRDMPGDLVVAEVEILSPDFLSLYGVGNRARVIRMIQGVDRSGFLTLRADQYSGCSFPFANGTTGLIVGRILTDDAEGLVIAPIMVRKHAMFRLPEDPADWPTTASVAQR